MALLMPQLTTTLLTMTLFTMKLLNIAILTDYEVLLPMAGARGGRLRLRRVLPGADVRPVPLLTLRL